MNTESAAIGAGGGWRAAWLVLAITIAVRAVMAMEYPLLPDETYFWEWSRRLAAGFYDHPPGVAWTIGAGTALFGDTTFGVRAASLACSVVAAVGLIVAARDIGGSGAAFRAAMLFAVLPLSSGLIFAMPDAPLAACISIATLATIRATTGGQRATTWWLVAGVAAGFAMATKLSGVFAPLGVAVACAAIPGYRRVFLTRGPYLATGVAALILSPVLWWNANHDWIAFRFQLEHGLGNGDGDIGAAAVRVLAFVGGQLLVTGVLLGGAMFAVLFRAARGRGDDRAQFLAVITLVAIVPFVVSAVRRPVEPNWTAVAYPALLLLLATSDVHCRAPRVLRSGVILAALVVSFAYLRALGALPSGLVPSDPLSRAHGWRALAHAMDGRVSPPADGTVFLAADRYQEASQIAFHTEGKPFALALNLGGRGNQYDLWPGFPDLASPGDHLIVALVVAAKASHPTGAVQLRIEPSAVVEMLVPHFRHVRLDTLVSGVGEPGRDLRGIWVFEDWSGTWPIDR